jgi:hypothetical protein
VAYFTGGKHSVVFLFFAGLAMILWAVTLGVVFANM